MEGNGFGTGLRQSKRSGKGFDGYSTSIWDIAFWTCCRNHYCNFRISKIKTIKSEKNMTYENLKKLVKYCRKIQTVDDSDIYFGVTGRKGGGKTTFDVQFTRDYISEYFNENYFSIKKYFCYNNKQVEEKLHTLPEYSPIIGDEAIRFAWSRDWNKVESKDLIKLSTQIREKHHILFMNIPRMAWIDKAYREGLLSMWAWIHSTIEDGEKKSYALIFEPDENQGEPDSWHLKQLRQTEGRINRIGKFTDIDKMYKLVKNHPCFMDIIQFPKLPEEIYDEYKKLKKFYALEKGTEYVDQRQMGKIMSYNLMRNWDKLQQTINEGRFSRPTYRMLADVLCHDPRAKKSLVQHTTVRNWVSEIAARIPNQEEIQAVLDIESQEKEDEEVYEET